jgi:cellulose synthase/poly-beta-1,6-N-acetylglucosamine synthase-like glycosyltransferase
MPLLLWLAMVAVFWPHIGYPALLFLLARLSRRSPARADVEPTVTVIVAAHNEEAVIGRKVEETLRLDYPAEKLDVIVAADGCTDATCAIVEAFADPRVRVLDLQERNGKTAAQNAAAAAADGEILIFTDATTEVPHNAIRGLVSYFADPMVGCAGAELEYVSREGTAVGSGGATYWSYEKTIKRLESKVNSLIGVSGCLYAVRADAYRPIDPDLTSDFVIASDVAAQGKRVVYAEGIVAQEDTNERSDDEFRMRVRVIIQSIHALVRKRAMLNPWVGGFFAFQLFSHKVLRYLTPLFLAAILGLNIAIATATGSPLYVALLVAQLIAYAAAATQYLLLRVGIRWRLLVVPFYFLHANAAALWALVAYLRGERAVTWTPIR